MFYRVSKTNDSQRENRRGNFARNTYVTLLCLFYLVSNTQAFPSLYQGKICRCVEQVQVNSECCCSNKTQGNKSTKSKSTCSTGKHPKRSCCTDQKKQQPNSKTDSKRTLIMSCCGCSSSAKEGLHSNAPRDVNPGPVLLTADSLTVPLDYADVFPVTFDYAPDTPPPQRLL